MRRWLRLWRSRPYGFVLHRDDADHLARITGALDNL